MVDVGGGGIMTIQATNQLVSSVAGLVVSVGDCITQNQNFGSMESVKSASDLVAPISGTVEEVNEALTSKPNLLNEDPYGEGWLIVVAPINIEVYGDEKEKKATKIIKKGLNYFKEKKNVNLILVDTAGRHKEEKALLKEMQEIAKRKGGKCLSNQYINSSTKMKWQCGEEHIWNAISNSIKQGTWCPICESKRRITRLKSSKNIINR